MKEIEKLAKEHVESQIRPKANELIKIYSQMDYMAGFLKAREMTIQALKDGPKIMKLAEESVRPGNENEEYSRDEMLEAYGSGFLKAREMALTSWLDGESEIGE